MREVPRFRLERDLVDSFKEVLLVAIGHDEGKSLCVLEEPNVCGVIPDFLIGRWISDIPDFPKKPLTNTEAHVLWSIQHCGQMKLSELASELFLSDVAAQKCIQRLRKIGFLDLSESGLMTAVDIAGPRSVEVIAIEMKLRRWREALQQTKNYRSFADLCYVVLDGSQVRITCEIEESFRTAGVGLMLQIGGTIQQVCPAVNAASLCRERLKAVEKLRSISSHTRVRPPPDERI